MSWNVFDHYASEPEDPIPGETMEEPFYIHTIVEFRPLECQANEGDYTSRDPLAVTCPKCKEAVL